MNIHECSSGVLKCSVIYEHSAHIRRTLLVNVLVCMQEPSPAMFAEYELNVLGIYSPVTVSEHCQGMFNKYYGNIHISF